MPARVKTHWERYPQPPFIRPHTVVGDVRVLRGVSGGGLEPRDIYVYLPPGYDHTRKRFPVLYLQDGQNAFDDALAFAGEWGADDAAEALAEQGLPCIIVAVPNAGNQRMSEYNPWPRSSPKFGTVEAKGPAYLAYLTTTIRGIVNLSFRTRIEPEYTAIGGSSLGGLISAYAALAHPDVFGYCIAMSPALWFSFGEIFSFAAWPRGRHARFYVDIGGQEGRWKAESGVPSMVKDARRLRDVLSEHGHVVAYVEDKNGRHTEADWRRRFPAALEWFLAPSRRPDGLQGFKHRLGDVW